MRPINTQKITSNLAVIKTLTVNFFIYSCEDGLICFDAGFGKSLIKRQLKRLDIDPTSITHVFLTQSDFDHADGLAVFENAKVYLSSDEEQMITGKKARAFGFIHNFRIKRPYSLLHDHDVFNIGTTKIKAIATPGHTTGSMSYLVDESILFVGDAFKLKNSQVCSIRRFFNMDTEKQKGSIRKLACLDYIELACTAHTGCTNKFRQAIQDWK